MRINHFEAMSAAQHTWLPPFDWAILPGAPRSENSDIVPPGSSGGSRVNAWASGELSHCSRFVRIKNSGDQGHAHEIGEACSLHLDHEIGPVVLDRSGADPEVIGNLLVGMPCHQSLEDIALAVRQRREAGPDIAALGLTLLISIPPVKRRPHGRE